MPDPLLTDRMQQPLLRGLTGLAFGHRQHPLGRLVVHSMPHVALTVKSVRFLVVCVAQCEHPYKKFAGKASRVQ
jgi:hypothetical protein